MILYFSSAIPYVEYNKALGTELITVGQQAQKFNHLLIEGLSTHDRVIAISNPPYNKKGKNECIDSKSLKYCVSGGNSSRTTRKSSNIIQMFKFAKREILRERCSAIIVDSINLGAIFVAKLIGSIQKIPVIGVVTDVPEFMCKGRMNLALRIDAWLMKRLDGYVLLTEEMNNVANPSGKPHIVMEGSCEVTYCNKEIALSDDISKKVCLFSGSVNEANGINILVKAFQMSSLSDVDLHIYGSGPYTEKLVQACRRHSNILYNGTVRNDIVVNKQKEADLLINPRPSNIEFGAFSFPSKLIEYMASGTPVLTTRLPGIPIEYYDYVYVIEDESPSGIAVAIRNALHEKRNLGIAAQKFVCEKKNNIEQARRIYEFAFKIVKNK